MFNSLNILGTWAIPCNRFVSNREFLYVKPLSQLGFDCSWHIFYDVVLLLGFTGRHADGESSSTSSSSSSSLALCKTSLRSRTEINRDPPQLLRGIRKPTTGTCSWLKAKE